MERVEHDLSAEQWGALKEAWGGGCAYCGEVGLPLQRDCVLPISRSGRCRLGRVPGPALSLRRVGRTGSFHGWLRRKRLDERAFLVRHGEVGAALSRRFGARDSREA